ncbi:MAG: hypothetical protein HY740_01400 [Chloroflexi bacterium]|nr:hypothetical protein [Chloroflexota bacterium]
MRPIVPTNTLIAIVVALVIGVGIGLPLGWFTVSFNFSETAQTHLVQVVADSFILSPNADKANARLTAFLGSGDKVKIGISTAICKTSGTDQARIKQMAAILNIPTTCEPTPPPDNTLWLALCGGGLVILVLGGGGAYFIMKRGAASSKPKPQPTAVGRAPAVSSGSGASTVVSQPTGGPIAEAGEEPVSTFKTTYMLGDDLFDESFSIDDQQGNFLGECGVVIGETVGVGDPKKVTAFEVWLFDKSDIRTVTKVLMSEHAFRDEGSKNKLASKGDPVLGKSGEMLEMETAALKVQARVVDMQYGSGALPPNSFFQQITLEISAWKKPESAAAPTA